MPDREKVIKALEICAYAPDPCPADCPYNETGKGCNGPHLPMFDALDLLKEVSEDE